MRGVPFGTLIFHNTRKICRGMFKANTQCICCCHMYNIIIIHNKIGIFYQNKHARTLTLSATTTVHRSMANRLNARQRQPIKHRKQKCVKSFIDILYYYLL